MPAELAVIILLGDERDAVALARLLAAVRSPRSAVSARVLTPPVRGLGFFADEERQAELDAWWSVEIPRTAWPLYVAMDEDGLEGWLAGLDGDVYVGVQDPARLAAYARAAALSRRAHVRALLCSGPFDLAAAVMHDLSGARAGGAPLYDEAEALRVSALSPRFPLRSRAPDPGMDGLRDAVDSGGAGEGGGGGAAGPGPGPESEPWLIGSTAATFVPVEGPGADPGGTAAAAPRGSPTEGGGGAGRWSRRVGGGLAGLLHRRSYQPRPDPELARLLAARGPTIVVTGSRKGGVGKTSFAAGIAIVAGTVLDQIGHRACIVDANLGNPDAWGEMRLPPEAATVRDTVAALLVNQEPPPPVFAATPALACYPEVRDATEYSRTAVRRLAEHLRRRYTLTVVDMSNRLPDPTAGPEAAVAAYWLEVADVLVLPTTSARADFNGALDYLEVGGLPPTVVPYIVSGSRRLRDNPTTHEYVRAIRRRAHALIEVPDDANAVRLAGMEGVPAEQLSPDLGLAYRRITETIATMPRRPGH